MYISVRRIECDLNAVKGGIPKRFCKVFGDTDAIGVEPGNKPFRIIDQIDEVLAKRWLTAGEGKLGDSGGTAFIDNMLPVLRFELGFIGLRLTGGITVDTFLVAMPCSVF